MSDELITEDDIAAYLLRTPDFFERYADVLLGIQLISPRGQRAVSLQERQMELLRDKIKGLELRMAHMMRAGSENDQLYSKMNEWILPLLSEKTPDNIPTLLVEGLRQFFDVPQVALRAWALGEKYADSDFAQPVPEEIQAYVKNMNGEPYCGQNPEVGIVGWLEAPSEIRSVALLPLQESDSEQPYGLIVLGAIDVHRFTSDMGVDILKNIAALASTALSRCID